MHGNEGYQIQDSGSPRKEGAKYDQRGEGSQGSTVRIFWMHLFTH